MSAIQQMVVATAGGAPLPTVIFNHISLSTANEGDTVYVYYDYSNFNGETVYWSIAYDATSDSANFTDAVDGSTQLYGSNFNIFQIHPKANNVTSGNWYYYVNLGSTYYGSEYGSFGPYTVNDTSTTPNTSLVFDIDPANITSTTMGFGGVGFNCPDTGGLSINGTGYYATTSTSAGGTLVLDANVGARVQVQDLTHSNYQSVSVSAWIKPTSATGITQTIVAKEVCYKLRVNSDGSLSWGVSLSGSGWTYTAITSAGAITAGSWYHVAATVDVSHTTLYINGQQVAQTTGLSLGRNSNPFVIGAYGNPYGLSDFFTGLMGEVKMWNYAVTDSDVLADYNTTMNRYVKTSGSFSFSGVQSQYITLGGNPSDWALGKTGTIEWWQKAPSSNFFYGNFNGGMITQGSQGGDGQHGLDIFGAGGNIALGLGGGGVQPYVVEPSTSTWTHVAISFDTNPGNTNVGKSHVYFNGVEQSINNDTILLTNSTDAIHIGSRVPDANYQNWTGKITNIHISTANLYTGNFTPTIRTAATTGTVFLMNSDHPTTDLSSSAHTITGGIYELSDDLPVIAPFSLTAPPSDGRYLPWRDRNSNVTANIVNTSGNWATTSTYGGGIVWDSVNHGYVQILNYTGTGTNFTLSFAADFQPEAGHWNSIFGDYYSNGPFAYAYADTITAGVGSNDPVNVSSGVTGLAWWDFVYSGTTLTIYKNGTQVATGTLNFATSIGSNLQIGTRNGASGDYLVGTLYQIKYQEIALDSTGITDQYNSVKSTYGLL